MKLRILGNGGAVSDGLYYNSFIIDGKFLVETPPDILTSLYRYGYDLQEIEYVFISHFHADHCFGFPFLALRLFYEQSPRRLTVFAPGNAERKIRELCTIAFGGRNPYHKWIDRFVDFSSLVPGEVVKVGEEFEIEITRMKHSPLTCGFSLYKEDALRFSYMPDTLWAESLKKEILKGPPLVLVDLNGEPADLRKIHMSEQDLIEKAVPLSGKHTRYFGTHLKRYKVSEHEMIEYVTPGQEIGIC